VPEQVAFLAKFSHLSDNAPPAGTITDASKSEKGSVGLETMPPAAIARLADSIKAYKAKFGYTYTICVRRHTAAFIHSELERRLRNDAAQELEVTMKEVADIARLRVVEQVKGPGAPTVYGELSTHVMDAIAGRPAVGMRIELFEPRADKLFRVAQGEMNETGRINLMEKRPVPIGRYELRFAVADYFKRRGVGGNSPPYIDYVPVRFAINDAEGRYHIPLICSPSSFAVYRGS
jgi:2-oxo-4-hydroxy-4-carboxy-5-ureidoimidazoline decarboxylase